MALNELKPSQYKVLLDELYDGVYFVDTERRIRYWNKAAEELSGYSSAAMVGRFCYDKILCHTDDSGRELCQNDCPLQKSMDRREKCKADVYLKHKQGHRVSVSVRVAPITDNGEVVGAIEVFLDNSSRKKLQRRTDELSRMAYYDKLTGLVNRRYLEMRLEQACQEFVTFAKPHALILFDIDHFKNVNDTYGHLFGDKVICAIADTLKSKVKGQDAIARIGGEEFAVLLPETDVKGALVVAEQIRHAIEHGKIRRFDSDEQIGGISISIGIASHSKGSDLLALLDQADKALYTSKQGGRNRTSIFGQQ